MNDWTSGYVADIGYTFGYYHELNPLRTKLIMLYAGLQSTDTATACELGFGQGLSINIHAAASKTEWHGTDFNPSQVGFAQELATVTDVGTNVSDEAFEEFTNRIDLPDFDFISLHGIWSWVNEDNRHILVDFVRRKLKVGGVLYMSYNTLPGWSIFAPMRHLMVKHTEIYGSVDNGIVNNINQSIAFVEDLLATNPAHAKSNPLINERVEKIKEQDRHYLAHEYFNRDWVPMYFSTVNDRLSAAKVEFACSAHHQDHIEAINITTEQKKLLDSITDKSMRESVFDFMTNQQFRRDYWIKGPRKLSALEQAEGLRALRVMLTVHRPNATLEVNGALGDAKLTEAVYNPIFDLLADLKIKTIAQIEQAAKEKGITFSQVLQAIMLLTGTGQMAVVQDDETIAKAKKSTEKLNAHLMQKARSNGDITYLASPVTGGGYAVGRFHQLFLLALKLGKKQPSDWAQFAWQIIAAQGQRLTKEGNVIESAEENINALTQQAKEFNEKRLPVLKALKIA